LAPVLRHAVGGGRNICHQALPSSRVRRKARADRY
jgi:hypothetical protein